MNNVKNPYEPSKTKSCGWVFLCCTLFFDLMLLAGAPVTMHLLPGDHSLYNLIAIGFASDELSKTSVWYVLLRFVGYLTIASLLLKIPVCVAGIWKNKELPLLLLIVAAIFNACVLECYAVALNGFPIWIQADFISIVFHIVGNTVIFTVLLRQLLAKRREKREKRERIGA